LLRVYLFNVFMVRLIGLVFSTRLSDF
jgi:hypothetical protein